MSRVFTCIRHMRCAARRVVSVAVHTGVGTPGAAPGAGGGGCGCRRAGGGGCGCASRGGRTASGGAGAGRGWAAATAPDGHGPHDDAATAGRLGGAVGGEGEAGPPSCRGGQRRQWDQDAAAPTGLGATGAASRTASSEAAAAARAVGAGALADAAAAVAAGAAPGERGGAARPQPLSRATMAPHGPGARRLLGVPAVHPGAAPSWVVEGPCAGGGAGAPGPATVAGAAAAGLGSGCARPGGAAWRVASDGAHHAGCRVGR